MKTDRETIYATSICSNRIINLKVFDSNQNTSFCLTKFERKFLGLKDTITMDIRNDSFLNKKEKLEFVVKKDDCDYYKMFKELLDSLNNAAILGKSENCYRFFQNSDGIVIIGDHSKESYCLLEIKEGTKEYKAFNSLFFDLITINEIEKVKKLHK